MKITSQFSSSRAAAMKFARNLNARSRKKGWLNFVFLCNFAALVVENSDNSYVGCVSVKGAQNL